MHLKEAYSTENYKLDFFHLLANLKHFKPYLRKFAPQTAIPTK